MTLSLDTAYRSFGGEVEASSTPTICRLPDSRRHQLWATAHVPTDKRFIFSAAAHAQRAVAYLHGVPKAADKRISRKRLMSVIRHAACRMTDRRTVRAAWSCRSIAGQTVSLKTNISNLTLHTLRSPAEPRTLFGTRFALFTSSSPIAVRCRPSS